MKRYELEYEEAKRKTKEILHPLKLQLAEASDHVNEAVSKVASAKAANFKLDDAIQQILKLSSTA